MNGIKFNKRNHTKVTRKLLITTMFAMSLSVASKMISVLPKLNLFFFKKTTLLKFYISPLSPVPIIVVLVITTTVIITI